MPTDLDELFSALGAHADQVPLGTAESARRRGERRRRRLASAGLAVVAVATVAAVAGTQLAVRPAPPAEPTLGFMPLRPAGVVPMELTPYDPRAAEGRYNGSAIVDGVAYVVSNPAGRHAELGALDLVTGALVFPTVDLGGWMNGIHLRHAGPEGLLLVGSGDRSSTPMVVDPGTGTVRWQIEVDPFTQLVSTSSAIFTADGSTGLVRALDWQTGAELWRRHYGVDGLLFDPDPTSLDLPATARQTSTHTDELVFIDKQGGVDVIDIRNGDILRSFDIPYADNTQVIAGVVYTIAGGEVWAYPLEPGAPPTLVYAEPDGGGGGVDWCGPSVLCVYEGSWFPGEDRIVLIDLDTHRELARIKARGAAQVVGDRVLAPDGLFDLAGNLLGDLDVTGAYAWWITAGSMLTLSPADDDGTRGQVHGLRTEDGASVLLGAIPLAPTPGCSVDERYLVCAAPDGFDAWQFRP